MHDYPCSDADTEMYALDAKNARLYAARQAAKTVEPVDAPRPNFAALVCGYADDGSLLPAKRHHTFSRVR